MTVDELIQHLIKIKEVYPDGGKLLVKHFDGIDYIPIKLCKKLVPENEVVIE